MTYPNPVDALLTALADFECSITIRDRLTQPELKTFDQVFLTKVKELARLSVQGTYSQQLQALWRLTRARDHLRSHAPKVVEDVSGIIGRLVGALGGGEIVSVWNPLINTGR